VVVDRFLIDSSDVAGPCGEFRPRLMRHMAIFTAHSPFSRNLHCLDSRLVHVDELSRPPSHCIPSFSNSSASFFIPVSRLTKQTLGTHTPTHSFHSYSGRLSTNPISCSNIFILRFCSPIASAYFNCYPGKKTQRTSDANSSSIRCETRTDLLIRTKHYRTFGVMKVTPGLFL
jgi:hypothetical protein